MLAVVGQRMNETGDGPARIRRPPASGDLRIRPLAVGEGAVLQRVFDGMSPRSRYLRYHSAMPRLTAAYRTALTAVDGRRHVVLVAERFGPHGWVAVGLGRLVALGDAGAEIAAEVVDAAQRQGIGRALVIHLVAVAEALDYRWIEAAVLSSNAPVLRLLTRLFPGARRSACGTTISFEISLQKQ